MKLHEALVGAKLIYLDPEKIVVKKDRTEYTLAIIDDWGDCCGYNEIKTTLTTQKGREPIITKVDLIEYPEKENDCGSRVKITFFGEYAPMAGEIEQIASIDSYSSSGSGWWYGACVTIECEALNVKTILSKW